MSFTAKLDSTEFGDPTVWALPVQEASAEDIMNRWIPIMASPLVTARQLAGSAALVTGVAAGLAALLGAEGMMPGCPGNPRLLEADEAAAAVAAAVKVGTVSWHDLSCSQDHSSGDDHTAEKSVCGWKLLCPMHCEGGPPAICQTDANTMDSPTAKSLTEGQKHYMTIMAWHGSTLMLPLGAKHIP